MIGARVVDRHVGGHLIMNGLQLERRLPSHIAYLHTSLPPLRAWFFKSVQPFRSSKRCARLSFRQRCEVLRRSHRVVTVHEPPTG